MHPSQEAAITAEKQRMTFVYGDIKSSLLKAFRQNRYAYFYFETADDSLYAEIDTNEAPVYDDIMAGSFKVGDNFTCQIREGRTEVFFQYKLNKNIVNLYDPGRYFRPEKVEGEPELLMVVKMDGIAIIALSPIELSFQQYSKMFKKAAKSVINYDRNDNAVIKKTAHKLKAPETMEWSFS